MTGVQTCALPILHTLNDHIHLNHGVATRRLGNYLAWFKWIWSFKVCKSSVQLANLIVKQAAKFTYETTWSEYKVTPYPFFDYWIKQARWDAHARKAIYGAA